MRIGLLSDTHGTFDPHWQEHFQDCDEIWHAGDFGSLAVAEGLQQWAPLRGVFGNIDGPEIRAQFPEHLRFQVCGLRVWMTHIGGQPRKYPPAIRRELQENPPHLFVCGHSHILRVEKDRYGVLHLNPGACGRQGFHLVRTLLRMEVAESRIRELKVVELGPR